MRMNRRLHAVYQSALAEWSHTLPAADGVSRPLLLHVPASYSQATIRLMIVGQETFGWGVPGRDSVDELLANYREFDLGRNYRRSPFWQAAHRVHRALNPEGPEHAFLWSNLVKVDQHQRRPDPAVEEAVCRLGLLPAEMAITQPDVVIFFTGPQYDERLRSTFPGVVYKQLSPALVQLEHTRLPVHGYRTYHPGYLRRSRRWDVLDELASRARAA